MVILVLRIMFGNTWLLQWRTSKLRRNAKVFAYDTGEWEMMKKGPPPWWKSTYISTAMMHSHITIWYFLISSFYI